MYSDNSPVSPDFSAFSWGEKQSSIVANTNTPKSPSSDTTDKIRNRKEAKLGRRRIVRACMRCRLRKTKCDGGKPCTRCTEADDVCEYMKCSKKESKEYSQDYVERLLEQNDKYKTAMRVLYANRRLSIQPDSIIIPSTESEDVPLVHDILDRLGLLGRESDTHSQRSETPNEKPQLQSTQKQWSTSSVQSSQFTSPYDAPSTIADTTLFEMPSIPEFDAAEDMLNIDTDMSLEFPFEVYETINTNKDDIFSPFTSYYSMGAQNSDWCPLDVLGEVLHGSYPVEQSYTADSGVGFSY